MSTLHSAYWQAVIAALKANTTLVDTVTYIGEVPEDENSYPVIWIEDGGTEDWSTKTGNGIEARVTLHIGSRYNGTEQIRTIKDLIMATLHFVNLTTATDIVVVGCFVNSSDFFDPDGKTRHSVMTFNYLVCED